MMGYRVYRMKESVRQQFRWAPHTIGVTMVKPRDYEQIHTTEATGPYALWLQLKDSDTPLQVGDILESESGELRIYKYVGFEEAQWQAPDAKPSVDEPASGTGRHEVSR
jgi:hypothetical protein